MKHFISLFTSILLTIIIMAGCGGYARNYNEPIIEEGSIRARKLLSVEQQREFDKIYLEAIRQKLNNQMDAAYELLQHALDINPNSSEALYETAIMQLNMDPRVDSILVKDGEMKLQKAVQLEPSNPYFRNALAERWLMTGKYARAARLYEQMIKAKPKSQDVAILTRLYEILEDYPSALKAIELLETLEGVNEKTTAEKFNILYESGDVARAFGMVEHLSEENPQELTYRVLLGDLYLEKGYKEKAIAIYEDVLTSDSYNVPVRTSLLHYYLTENDTARFNSKFREFLTDERIEDVTKFGILQEVAGSILSKENKLSPSALSQHFQTALTLPQQDSRLAELWFIFSKAAELPEDDQASALNATLALAPEKIDARMELLRYYIVREDIDNVTSLCLEGIKQAPEALLFYYYAGMGLAQTDHIAEAIDLLEEGTSRITVETDVDTDIAAGMYSLLGDSYFDQECSDKAFAAYDKALEFKPDDLSCLNNYAYYLSKKGVNLDKALNMSKKTVDAEPDNATYLDTYAWVLHCKRQYTQARIYIDKAIKLLLEEEDSPSNSTYYDHAGDIYFRCGQKAEAIEHWQHARQISNDDELNKKLDKKIKTKRI